MITSGPVAPLAVHQLLVFLLQVAVLLALALVLGRLATKYGMPAVIGELLAGVLVGPSLLGHLAPGLSAWLLPRRPDQMHLLDAFGQFSVILFIGVTGTQIDLALARRCKVIAAKVSTAGLVLPLGLGVAAGLLFPASLVPGTADRTVFALFMGVAMSVSALPVIAKTLADMGLLHRNIGQLTMIAGLIDDACGWLMLSLVAAMAATGPHHANVASSTFFLVGFLVCAITLGRRSVRMILRPVVRAAEPAMITAAVVVMLLAGAAITLALGLEAVLGAFVFGMIIRSTGLLRADQLGTLGTVVMGVLAPLFFATAGLRMDLAYLGRPVVVVTALVLLVIAVIGKFAGAFIGARISRLDRWEALALGAGMNARGVIQIVVASVGLRLAVIGTDTYTIIVLVAIATSLMAPPILRIATAHIDYTAEERLRAADFTTASSNLHD